jgi:tetratricopeptide (TPR) repeat protein
MRIQNFSRIGAALLFVAVCAGVSFAQVQATGVIKLRQADGTTVPLKDAQVVFHRTDAGGEFKVKTDRNGRYTYLGLPIGVYTIIVSGPNARPTYSANIRLGQQPENNFTLEPGDGSTITLAQVREFMAANPAAGSTGSGGESAEARRIREENERRAAAAAEERRNVEAETARLNEILRAGNDAFTAKKYDEAIRLYDQGIQAVPDRPEASVFYRNRGVAVRARGVDRYNASRDAAARNTARADFKDSVEMMEKAITLLRARLSQQPAGGAAASAAATPGAASTRNAEELSYLSDRAESYRIALATSTQVDAEAAVKAIQEYVNAETDPEKKARAQASLGSALFQSGKIAESVAAFRQTLAANPNNIEAMFGLGLALAADPTGAQATEARTLFQQFLAKAPANDPRRAEVNTYIETLNATIRSTNTPPETNRGGRRGRP